MTKVVLEQNMVDWMEGTVNHDDPKYCDLCEEQKERSVQKWTNQGKPGETGNGKAFRACNKHSEFLGRYYNFYLCKCGAYACSHC
jgi:hypothetical protein